MSNEINFGMFNPRRKILNLKIKQELAKRLANMRSVKGQEWNYIPTLAFRGVQKLLVEWHK